MLCLDQQNREQSTDLYICRASYKHHSEAHPINALSTWSYRDSAIVDRSHNTLTFLPPWSEDFQSNEADATQKAPLVKAVE